MDSYSAGSVGIHISLCTVLVITIMVTYLLVQTRFLCEYEVCRRMYLICLVCSLKDVHISRPSNPWVNHRAQTYKMAA